MNDSPKSFDEQEREFHQHIGECIASWAGVEEELFNLCRVALGATRERSAIVYARTPSIEGRLELTHELVTLALPKKSRPSGGHDHPATKAWLTLFRDIKSLLMVRNAIAHRPITSVLSIGVNERGRAELGDSWMEIYQHTHDQYRGKSDAVGALKIEDLKAHHEKVAVLRYRLRAVIRSVRATQRKGRPRRQSPQETD